MCNRLREATFFKLNTACTTNCVVLMNQMSPSKFFTIVPNAPIVGAQTLINNFFCFLQKLQHSRINISKLSFLSKHFQTVIPVAKFDNRSRFVLFKSMRGLCIPLINFNPNFTKYLTQLVLQSCVTNKGGYAYHLHSQSKYWLFTLCCLSLPIIHCNSFSFTFFRAATSASNLCKYPQEIFDFICHSRNL